MPNTFLSIWPINAAWQPKQWPAGPLLLAPSASVAVNEQARPKTRPNPDRNYQDVGTTLVSLSASLVFSVSEVSTQLE